MLAIGTFETVNQTAEIVGAYCSMATMFIILTWLLNKNESEFHTKYVIKHKKWALIHYYTINWAPNTYLRFTNIIDTNESLKNIRQRN